MLSLSFLKSPEGNIECVDTDSDRDKYGRLDIATSEARAGPGIVGETLDFGLFKPVWLSSVAGLFSWLSSLLARPGAKYDLRKPILENHGGKKETTVTSA